MSHRVSTYNTTLKLIASCIYVFLACLASGYIAHFLIQRNNPDIGIVSHPFIIIAITIVIAVVLFALWPLYILGCFLFFRKKITLHNLTYFLIKDSYTYFPFYIFFLHHRSASVLEVLPFLCIACSVVLKLLVFKKNLLYVYTMIEKNLYSTIHFFKNIPSYCTFLNTKITTYLASPHHTAIVNKTYKVLKIFLMIYIVLIGLSTLHHIYQVPVDKPYFTGKVVDEPFSINAGINILYTKGNPLFYNYGGTSCIPFTISYYINYLRTHDVPYFKYFGEKFYFAAFPQRWDTYPVRPIYHARIAAVILCVIGTILFVGLFSWYLLPIPFFLFKMVDYSELMAFYRDTLMGNTHIAFAAVITCIFFIVAILKIHNKKYVTYMYLCFICASIAASIKLTGFSTFIFPFSLLAYMYMSPDSTVIAKNKILLKVLACSVLPYLVLTPAVILDSARYITWFQTLAIKKRVPIVDALTANRIDNLVPFIKDLFFLKAIPTLLVIILGIASAILLMRIHPFFFIAVVLFHMYTFRIIFTNLGDFPFTHLYMIFLFTPVVFLFFPLIYGYKKCPTYCKLVVLIVCTGLTLSAYTPRALSAGFHQLAAGTFTKDWARESRDEYVDFVQKNNFEIFFFDFHSFSLPDTLHRRTIFFNDLTELPATLKPNQIVCFIKYNPPEPEEKMDREYKKYCEVTTGLYKKYEVVGMFGNETVGYHWNCPGDNPTIVCLKE